MLVTLIADHQQRVIRIVADPMATMCFFRLVREELSQYRRNADIEIFDTMRCIMPPILLKCLFSHHSLVRLICYAYFFTTYHIVK